MWTYQLQESSLERTLRFSCLCVTSSPKSFQMVSHLPICSKHLPSYFIPLPFHYFLHFLLRRCTHRTFGCLRSPWTFPWSGLCSCIKLGNWQIRLKQILLHFLFDLSTVEKLSQRFQSSTREVLEFWTPWQAPWLPHNTSWEISHTISCTSQCKV